MEARRFSAPAGPNLATCWKQGTPVHTLPTLAGIPTAVLVSEASPLAQNQICTSQYLTQAGVANDFLNLPAYGIHGNGHLMNIEANSDQVVALLLNWLASKGL
jgi:acetyl esterase/lipase